MSTNIPQVARATDPPSRQPTVAQRVDTALAVVESRLDALEADDASFAVEVVAVRVPVTAGATTQGFFRPAFAGSVTAVHVVASSLITSAADGCLGSVLATAGTVVAEFDLEAKPAAINTAAALTLGAGVAFASGDLVRCRCAAGADVLGGQDLTYLITYTRTI